MRPFVVALLSAGLIAPVLDAAAEEPRPIRIDDLFAIRTVGDPRLSPDGRWVAYTVRRVDAEKDALDTDIYLVPVDGGEARRFTRSDSSETQPRFSPDGRSLAFLSSREGDHAQVWLADLRGGDPAPLTRYEASVSDLAWSPDGTRLALVVSDVDPDAPDAKAEGKDATPKPIVIRRLQFKQDGAGYLREIRSHLHLFEVATKASVQLTSGPYDESEPAWSPDGRRLAFVSNRTEEPDSNDDTDVFLVEAAAGAEPRRLVDSPGADHSPAFSPDGAQLAFVAGGDPSRMWYATPHLGVVPTAGGSPRILTRELDRHVSRPRFSADGRSILFLLEDGGNQHLARIPAGGGAVERIVAGEREVQAFDVAGGESVVLETRPDRPGEVYRVAPGGRLEPVTRENEALFAGLKLGRVERYQATSPDGTRVDAFLTHPPDAEPGARLPALLRIHGGPVGQYSTAFNLEWQILAAHGYAVIAANPRGSSGYGEEFSYAIWADWGNKDYEDVMAAVDRAVAMGVADPDRLGVGGWSYGGILTNYVITKTDRFRAAISGASEVNYLSNYGTDHYQREWETELGLPWENTELWIRLSPFFEVEKIVTPTLILCGEADMNVPLLNSEQLYQALRRLGRETELVIYPGQNHGIRVPSYQKDRYERYVAWYDRFVKGETPGAAQEAEVVSPLPAGTSSTPGAAALAGPPQVERHREVAVPVDR